MKDIISFIKETMPNDIFLYYLKYYPGTKILEYAISNGYLSDGDVSDIMNGLEQSYQVIPNRIKGDARKLYEEYYNKIREAAGSSFRITIWSIY